MTSSVKVFVLAISACCIAEEFIDREVLDDINEKGQQLFRRFLDALNSDSVQSALNAGVVTIKAFGKETQEKIIKVIGDVTSNIAR